MTKLRSGEVEGLAQGGTMTQWWDRDRKYVFLTPNLACQGNRPTALHSFALQYFLPFSYRDVKI